MGILCRFAMLGRILKSTPVAVFCAGTSLLKPCDESRSLVIAPGRKKAVLSFPTILKDGIVGRRRGHVFCLPQFSKGPAWCSSIHFDRSQLIRESPLCFNDKYELLCHLGHGAFGSVNKVLDKRTGDEYAVKQIPRNVLLRGETMFVREVHNLMELDHPHIVKLVEYFVEEKDVMLVFELCGGVDLFEKLCQVYDPPDGEECHHFEEREIGRIIRQILKALLCCHEHGIVHRDIKPENFMFKTKDATNLKMIDLGLSLHYDESATVVELTGTSGTNAYLAPERARGNTYNEKSDIWSVGVILYMLLSGEVLFPGSKSKSMAAVKDPKYLRHRLRSLNHKNLSFDAKDFLMKTLEHNPKARPSAKEALLHPFIVKSYELEITPPEMLKLNLVDKLQRFAHMPLLQRVALIILAHMMGTEVEDTKRLRLAFRRLDMHGRGALTYQELVDGLGSACGLKLPGKFKETVWPNVDVNKANELTFTEFLAATISLHDFAKADQYVLGIFEVLCMNHGEHITVESLADLLKEHTREELDGMLKEVAPSGKLSFDNFKHLMCKPKYTFSWKALTNSIGRQWH